MWKIYVDMWKKFFSTIFSTGDVDKFSTFPHGNVEKVDNLLIFNGKFSTFKN